MTRLRMILFDTDVMIDFLRGKPKAVKLVKAHGQALMFSSIVVAELYAGVKGDDERQVLDDLISLAEVIPVTIDLAKQGGLYKNVYGKSHGVGLGDAIIAATATAHQVELKTLNTKHYPMIAGLRSAY